MDSGIRGSVSSPADRFLTSTHKLISRNQTLRSAREKQLIAEYKKQPKKMGAYCIHNTRNDKKYVAVSRDIDARFNRHRFALRTNTEDVSEALQADWREQDGQQFEFLVLDTLEPPEDPNYDPAEDLLVLEGLWLDQIDSIQPKGYNKAP